MLKTFVIDLVFQCQPSRNILRRGTGAGVVGIVDLLDERLARMHL